MHPRMLVLDEPTSALDPTAAEDVLATLTRLVHDLGVSVVLAEHRLERVVPFADTLVRPRRRRRRCASGSPVDLLTDSPVAPPLVELGRAAGWVPAAPDRPRRPPARRTACGTGWARRPPSTRRAAERLRRPRSGGVTVTHGATLAVHDVSSGCGPARSPP